MTITINEEKPMTVTTRRPTHPGKIIKEDYLSPLSVTITELSSILGVSRKTLSKIINERGSTTPDIALRLSRAFDTTAILWLNLQKNYDLWQAENGNQLNHSLIKPDKIVDARHAHGFPMFFTTEHVLSYSLMM